MGPGVSYAPLSRGAGRIVGRAPIQVCAEGHVCPGAILYDSTAVKENSPDSTRARTVLSIIT